MATSLRHSFEIQRRVIGALLMREVITRFGRHNIGFLWLFVEPMIFTLGVASLWSLTGLGHGHGISFAAFAITGYSSVLLWRNNANRSMNAISANLALMHHRNVRVIDIFIARSILEIAGTTMSFVVLGSIFCALGIMEPPVQMLQVIMGWLILAWFGTALSMVTGCMSERSHLLEKFWHPATYLLFPLSGAAFMVEWLPPAMRSVVLWLPMVHGVEILRGGFFGPAVRAHFDFAYVLSACLTLTLVGLAQCRILGRQVAPE